AAVMSGAITIAAAPGRRCQGWIIGSTKLTARSARQYTRSTRGWRIWKRRGRNPAASTSRATWALQKMRFENHSGVFIGGSDYFHPFQKRSFYFLDHALNFLQFFLANLARFD